VSDYDRAIERHRRWNFTVNVGDLSFFNLAMAIVFPSTILPLYASHLTTSAVLIGLVPAIHEVSLYFPQILMSRHAETLACKRPFTMKVSVVERLPYLVIALSILLAPQAPAWLAYAVLAAGVGAARTAAGVCSPAWRGMLAKVIPADRRGMLFGTGYAVGGVLGIGGAWAAQHILATVAAPTSYGLCFLLAFVAQALSWTCLSLNREPAREPGELPPPFVDYMRDLPRLLGSMPSFSRFLVAETLLIFGGLATSFYVIYGRRVLGISDATAAGLTMAVLASQAIGAPIMGRLSDRFGHKWMNGLAGALGALAVTIMLVGPSVAGLALAFILMNLSQAGLRISQMSIGMDFGGVEKAPTFSAVMSTILAFPILAAPLVGGWTIDTAGFRPAFVAGLLLYVIGLAVLVLGVVDPRVATTRRGAR
jgi:MFS family permease